MLDERTRRRADYRLGTGIRLADGQCWTFPAPLVPSGNDPDAMTAGRADLTTYVALIRAVIEAEDRDDRRRCELALAIWLLSYNYDLDPADYQMLLGFAPGSAALARSQEAFSTLAFEHAQSLWSRRRDEATTTAAEPVGWVRGLWRAGVRRWAGRRTARAMGLASGPCR
jgi:hypothetical protein